MNVPLPIVDHSLNLLVPHTTLSFSHLIAFFFFIYYRFVLYLFSLMPPLFNLNPFLPSRPIPSPLSGIGLQTAYNMVQVMGGQLECSASDDQTVFWFTVHLEVAASGEYQYRSWSRRPSPFDSRRNSPYDSKKNSPYQSRRNSPHHSQKTSPFVSRKTSPQDSKCGTAPGMTASALSSIYVLLCVV
jgi:hypothetical protein